MNKEIEAICQEWRKAGVPEEVITERARLIETQSLACHPAWQLRERFEKIKDGRITVIPWPWGNMASLCPSLMPGTVTVVAGAPGATKSFMMLQCVNFWATCEIPVAILALEGSKDYYLNRLLAQIEKRPELTDIAWVRDNPDEVDAAMDRHAGWLDQVGQSICTIKLDSITYIDVLEWVRARARLKDRIIIVDPVTAADPQGRQWEADRMMVNTSAKIAVDYGASIIIVSHPAKAVGHQPSLDAVAGGAAVTRHVDAVIWLSAIEPKKLTVTQPTGREDIECNRVMYLLKVRDGRGQGKAIGFRFEGDSLLLAEQGVVIKEKKG